MIPDVLRDGGVYEFIERRKAERPEHRGDVFVVWTNVAGDKRFGWRNRVVDVLDCSAHESDNLTLYAPPAKLSALASALRCTAQWS